MSLDIRNLAWLRGIQIPGTQGFGQRLYESLTDVRSGVNTLEQQTNSNLQGTPTAPPQPDGLTVVPHPQGVEFSIQHEAEFYQGLKYEIDCTAQGQTHSYDVGSSRNGFLPVGPLEGTYQVRSLYPTGQSSAPVVFGSPAKVVRGASVDRVAMLPGHGSGTTKQGQPPGFGGPYRSSTGKPPSRT
jgi:hypothetical protein